MLYLEPDEVADLSDLQVQILEAAGARRHANANEAAESQMLYLQLDEVAVLRNLQVQVLEAARALRRFRLRSCDAEECFHPVL